MPDRSEHYATKSRWLKGSDLQPGVQVRVRISGEQLVEVKDMRTGEPSWKSELSFETLDGKPLQKRYLMNTGNFGVVKHAYGADTDEWKGRDIIIERGMTYYGTAQVPCVKLRIPLEDAPPGTTGLEG